MRIAATFRGVTLLHGAKDSTFRKHDGRFSIPDISWYKKTNMFFFLPKFQTNQFYGSDTIFCDKQGNYMELPEPPIKLRLVFLAPQPFVPRIRRRISSPMGLG